MASRAAPAVLLASARALTPELESDLGPARADALRAELIARATAWGATMTDAPIEEADAGESLSAHIARRQGAEPLLVIWPVVAQPRLQGGAGALEDLRTGADLVVGPVMDGGLYLLGLNEADPAILAQLERAWDHEDATPLALAAMHEHGLEVGVLRVERALRSRGDARAALADPLLPDRVRRILSG